MAFLHCHSCGWQQDDFYSVDGYNPASSLRDWMETLCSGDIDKQFSNCSEFIADNGRISTREVIAQEFEKYADRIRKMKWVTEEQWQKDKDNAYCPNCAARNFDID